MCGLIPAEDFNLRFYGINRSIKEREFFIFPLRDEFCIYFIFEMALDKVLMSCYSCVMKRMEWENRNERLIEFAKTHPKWTHEAIANVFHISRPRVTRILKRAKENKDAPKQ